VEEGYGLNSDAIERIATEYPGALVVTIDCGITAAAEARLARDRGLGLIVTDHHAFGPELPDADVLVHPRLPGGSYPFPELCGAGVAFKLAWQIARHFGDGRRASESLRAFLVRAFDLVALATIADVVPLVGENRVFVRHGLHGMNAPEGGPGLAALLLACGYGPDRPVTSQSVGYQLAPRINAAGRMSRALLAFELFTTSDPVRAQELALSLEQFNKERQEVERTILEEARQQVEAAGGASHLGAIIVASRDWHSGVIGIVASRLVDEFHRPAIVIALGDELGQGSARSIPGLDLHAALGACQSELEAYGGHAMAAGLKVRPDRLAAFRERFDQHCRDVREPHHLRRDLWIDSQVPLAMLSRNVVQQIELLEPYGQGNPRPVLLSERVTLLDPPRRFGQQSDHLRMKVREGTATLTAKAWRKADRWAKLDAGTPLDIAYEPRLEHYNGRNEVVLTLIDLKASENGPASE
jgi:single-stranded-DNA-specific exonuclease